MIILIAIILAIFTVSFIWVLIPLKNKTLIFRTKVKSGYTEGVLLNILLQEKAYIGTVAISSNSLYTYLLCKDPLYIERINILPYKSNKQDKKKILELEFVARSAYLHSRINNRN